MSDDLERNFIRVVRLAEAAGLPEVTIGTSYGTPALLVKDKSFVRMKDGETLVVMCALEEKEMLLVRHRARRLHLLRPRRARR